MPASIASECFQAHECFIAGLTPKLPGALEAGLILAASRFHRSAAQWLATLASRSVVQAITMGWQVVDFFFHRLANGTFPSFSQLEGRGRFVSSLSGSVETGYSRQGMRTRCNSEVYVSPTRH